MIRGLFEAVNVLIAVSNLREFRLDGNADVADPLI
jgi:hypothetical protein